MKRKAAFVSAPSALLFFLLLGVASLPAAAQDIGFERGRGKMMLDKVCKEVEKKFYDPDLHGLDWKGLCDQGRQRIESGNSVGEILTTIFAVVEQLQDSHTHFLPPLRAAKVLFGFEAKPFGNKILVYWLKDDGAAAKAGLQVGDQLLKVNGFVAERETFDLMWLFMRVLRPVADMEIVFSRGDEPSRTVHVEGKIDQKRIQWEVSQPGFDVWAFRSESDAQEVEFETENYEGGIGYLHFPYFTGREFYKMFVKDKVDDLKGSRAIIIDLRDNPGGSVDTLTYLCSFFEPEKAVMYNMVGRKKTEPMEVKPRRPNFQVPMFILVDSESSSAAEVFARHFQRTGRAVIIGDTTSGRVNTSRGYIYKVGMDTLIFYGLQVAEWRVVFPDGEELEKRGVTPDHRCVPTGEDLRQERDPCLGLALDLARKAVEGAEQQ